MDEWIDLTQPLGPDTPTRPPGRPAPEFEPYATVEADGYNGTRLHLDTHCGTHMDAPTHFLSPTEARTIDDVGPGEMVTEGVVLDFTEKPPGSTIGRDELRDAADRRDLRADDFVVLDCGNPPRPTDEYVHEYVYPTVGAAEFLVERDVACVATDALGVDELATQLQRHNRLPDLVVLLTGTPLVPPDEFTLAPGDRVVIDIENIGTLENPVTEV